MPSILFVDHAFHRISDSSRFFAELLARRFAVTELYVTPDARLDLDWQAIAGHDIVILWQLDYLAPLFLARGHRTVVVPMYDGSANLPQVHWAASGGARFLNFSRTLHERIRLLGQHSLLAKFFPPPVEEQRLPDFADLRAFLWQRRPEQGINAGLLGRLFGTQLKSVHVHDVPDSPAMAGRFAPPSTIGRAHVTVSAWFESRAEYYALLESCNVFVCPRSAEGIGMAMLEAMARGMLVVANDLPVQNEYVCNWVNGVLFNTASPGEADFSEAPRIARMGWHTVRDGHGRWLASTDRILDFIRDAPRYRAAPPWLIAQLDRELVPAYLAGGEIYERLLIRVLPSLANRQEVADDAGATALRIATAPPRRPPVAVVPAITDAGARVSLAFANGAARPLLGSGWSWDEDFGVWIEGAHARLSFAAALGFRVASLDVRLSALAPGMSASETAIRITVNDIHSSPPLLVQGSEAAELRCQILPEAPFDGTNWTIEFTCDRVHESASDLRQLSVALLSLDIEFARYVAPIEITEPPAQSHVDDDLLHWPVPVVSPRKRERPPPANGRVAATRKPSDRVTV